MFNWFKKKNKDEDKKVQEEKIDILTEDADAAQINEDAHENEKINFNQDAQSINQNQGNEEKVQEKPEEVKEEKTSFFKRMFSGLEKTRQNLNYKLQTVFKGTDINDDFYDELEEVLVTSDIGVETVMNIIDNLKERIVRENVLDRKDALPLLKDEIKRIMNDNITTRDLKLEPSPAILLVVGVNGVGKTTTIGKLSYQFRQEGKSVLIAAADTFRAAAIEQLKEWANRANVDIIAHEESADPASVIFDAIMAAKARKTDILICDTAGRLHNKQNLMNELNKIKRVIDREFPNAVKENLLVLDATTGQNAIIQAKSFKETSDITGVCVTKLDGTAKGGVIIALESELHLPVKIIGVGEKIEDLQAFNVDDFVEALF
ncbi:signal recognition particle-docking protein FtsY [Fenollaria massiliensis]|uniref:Signal recognition particle receptor FtsY n=2 Tax=Fenollaria massiliensis TaxID=938288 RepID=A0A9E7IVJ6_9FIRM|nr:signal recognition particle-docking protein FtsY [Fenollaria massiliensis]UQK59663.1 signal recognition particle-docking protein FtsY [Fenollaria massiliensis]